MSTLNKIMNSTDWLKTIDFKSMNEVVEFNIVDEYAKYYHEHMTRWIPVEEGLPEKICKIVVKWVNGAETVFRYTPQVDVQQYLSIEAKNYIILPTK